MSKKYGFVITKDGRELIAKLLTGEKLNLSRIMVGSGAVAESEEMSQLKTLVEPVALATSTNPVYDKTSVRMIVEYRSDLNGGLEHGFWLNEFGVYALDPDKGEVLIYYGSLGDYPQYVSAASETGVDVRRFPICIVIGEDLGVNVNWKCEAWMTAEDVKEYCTVSFLPSLRENFKELIDGALANHSHAVPMQDIVIPVTGWEADDDTGGVFGFHLDLSVAGATEATIPLVMLLPESQAAAKECGMSTAVRTLDGVIRLYAQKIPQAEITGSLALLGGGKTIGGNSGGSGGEYVLPTATAARLGGVKIGRNVNVEQDGTISVDEMGVLDEAVATGDDAQEMLDNVFGTKEAGQTEN